LNLIPFRTKSWYTTNVLTAVTNKDLRPRKGLSAINVEEVTKSQKLRNTKPNRTKILREGSSNTAKVTRKT